VTFTHDQDLINVSPREASTVVCDAAASESSFAFNVTVAEGLNAADVISEGANCTLLPETLSGALAPAQDGNWSVLFNCTGDWRDDLVVFKLQTGEGLSTNQGSGG